MLAAAHNVVVSDILILDAKLILAHPVIMQYKGYLIIILKY